MASSKSLLSISILLVAVMSAELFLTTAASFAKLAPSKDGPHSGFRSLAKDAMDNGIILTSAGTSLFFDLNV